MTRHSHIVLRNPKDVFNHPINLELYGEDIPPELQQSVEKYGIQEPVIVCRSRNVLLNNFIVSGRRRRNAAINAGISEIPTVEWECEDQSDFILKLINCNIRAELTNEQRLRMYEKLVEIEKQKSEARMKAGRVAEKPAPPVEAPTEPPKTNGHHKSEHVPLLKTPLPAEPTPQPEQTGRATEIAAEKVGLSRTTAEAGVAVIKKIDELKADGRADEAKELADTLNQRIHTAVRKVQGESPKPKAKPKPKEPAKKTCRECHNVCNALDRFCFMCGDELPSEKDIEEGKPPRDKHMRSINRKVAKIAEHWRLFEENRDKLIKELDEAKNNHQGFAAHFKKFEAIMTLLCDNCDFPKEHVAVLSKQWQETRKLLGEH